MEVSSNHAGLVTTALVLASGITALTAVQALIFALSRTRRSLNLYFAVMCMSATVFLFAESQYYATDSYRSAATHLQWRYAMALAFFPALFGFISEYSGQQRYRKWLFLLAAVSTCMIAINFFVTPYSLRYATLDRIDTVPMPWGEVLFAYAGATSSWNLVSRVIFSAVLGWAVYRAGILFRHGGHRPALFLFASLAFMLGAFILSTLMDFGYLQFIYPVGLSFLAVVLAMSLSLGLDMRDIDLSLQSMTGSLRKEVELHQQAEARIRHLAYHDYLTDLPNRTRLQELLASALEPVADSDRKGALIMLGMDDFQTVNDVLGHDIGDRLLQLVATRLRAFDVEGGTLTRPGGDEFIYLLPTLDCDSEQAESHVRKIAEKFLNALAQSFEFSGRSLDVGACAGTVVFSNRAEEKLDALELLQHVGMALNRAKAFGPGSIQHYAAGMQAEVSERLALERDMRKGLERGEFAVYYQPQIDPGGDIVGAEALLRWRHPEMGFISPAIFIPIAERSGLIRPLGEWVMQQACEQIKVWERFLTGPAWHLSVNVSTWQFIQRNYVEDVKRIAAVCGIDSSRLTLEITESAFIRDMADAISRINSLRSSGFRFSIDDFGTGYSSLSYLRMLPVDELKIDQSFVRKLGADPRDTHLVETIINLGKNMGMEVVAEGVESEAQRSALIEMDCSAFQGYHFAPPMEKGEFLSWLKDRYSRPGPNASARQTMKLK
jgi:diguanylate cyclase